MNICNRKRWEDGDTCVLWGFVVYTPHWTVLELEWPNYCTD